MRAHNPHLLAESVLYLLYDEAVTDGGQLTQSNIQARLPSEQITKTLITFAITDLRQRQFVENSFDNAFDKSIERFTISRKGYDYARYRLTLPGSAIYEFSKSSDWILSGERSGDDAPVDPNLVAKSQKVSTETIGEVESELIPASDRIVKRSDNQDAWSNAAEGVVALREAMIKTNDYGELDEDEFEQKLSEVRALETMLSAPQVQWEFLDQFATNTVKYLAVKFAENAIGHAASALMGYLTALTQGAF